MNFQENVSLRGFNTFKIGRNAKYFCVVKNIEELKEAICFAKENKIPFFVLGSGSNTLFSNEDFEGLVIKMEMIGYNVGNFKLQNTLFCHSRPRLHEGRLRRESRFNQGRSGFPFSRE